MDTLQRKHMIDRLDLVINEVRALLENGVEDEDKDSRIEELESTVMNYEFVINEARGLCLDISNSNDIGFIKKTTDDLMQLL